MADLPFAIDPALENSTQLGGELLDETGKHIGFDDTVHPHGTHNTIESRKRKPSPVPEPGKVAKQKTTSDTFKAGTYDTIRGDTVTTGASRDGTPGRGTFQGGGTVRDAFKIPNQQGGIAEYYPWSGGIVNRDTVRDGTFSHYGLRDDTTHGDITQSGLIQGNSLQSYSSQGYSSQGYSSQGYSSQGYSSHGYMQGDSVQGRLIQRGLVHGGNVQNNITQSGLNHGYSVQGNTSQGGLIQGNTLSSTLSSTNNVPASPDDSTPDNTGTNTSSAVASVHTHREPLGYMRIKRHGNVTYTTRDLNYPFHAVYSTAPPPTVDLRFMGDVPITSFELIIVSIVSIMKTTVRIVQLT